MLTQKKNTYISTSKKADRHTHFFVSSRLDFINIFYKMCEASKNYLWDLGDKVGSGATSVVYRAYNMETGHIVAAKVSKIKSIHDKEVSLLKNINHENIVRFIDAEIVITSNDRYASPNRQVLFIEFCNGGSVGDILRLPANRYGLSEDIVIQIMKNVTDALKYLHMKDIIHRDIKPDNILQSIDINGKAMFKLTDLGVARQINSNELTSDSIRGTEEFIHPIVYRQVFPDIKVNVNGSTVRTRVQFPFEVEMWSFGVTLYQCSTGRIPFQPFEGARLDRQTMGQILASIPAGCISGTQLTRDGEIQWSEVLPEWCRLSLNLKNMLKKLLARLFETNQDSLMKHREFFYEVDKILNLIPIYYLNQKKLTLTCTYFQPNCSMNELFDTIRQENNDENNVNYYCLFQNVHYPISSTEKVLIKTFTEQLPVQPSRDKPLVIYTFSPLTFDQKLIPKVLIPEIQPMRNIEDVFSAVHDWSKNINGLFYYVKNQLIEYEYIMKTTQSSIITIHRFLKTKLFKILSIIRNDIYSYQPFYELQKILHLIHTQNNSTTTTHENRVYHKSIIKDFPLDEDFEINSTKQRNLRSSIDFYQKLILCDTELSTIVDQYFNDELKPISDTQEIFNPTYLSKQISNYSLNIRKIDKYINDAKDLNETFRQDTAVNNKSNSLQMTSNILRQKLLQEVYDQYIHLINEGCYPLILEIFHSYRKCIKQQTDINFELQRIQLSYEEQLKKTIPINDLRQIITNELQKLTPMQNSTISNQSLTTSYRNNNNQNQRLTNVNNDERSIYSNRTNVSGISSTLHQTLEQAQINMNMLNETIRKLQRNIRNQTNN